MNIVLPKRNRIPCELASSIVPAGLFLRRGGTQVLIDTLWQQIFKMLDLFPPHECANFFVNSGYART